VAWRSLPDLPALADFDLNDLTATQLQLLYTQERALASGMSRHTTHYGYATLQTPGLFDGPDSPSLHRRSGMKACMKWRPARCMMCLPRLTACPHLVTQLLPISRE
jgi:hypothetical protein